MATCGAVLVITNIFCYPPATRSVTGPGRSTVCIKTQRECAVNIREKELSDREGFQKYLPKKLMEWCLRTPNDVNSIKIVFIFLETVSNRNLIYVDWRNDIVKVLDSKSIYRIR